MAEFNPQDFKDLTRATDKDTIKELSSRIWAAVDKDDNGSLSLEEMTDMMKQMACAYAEATGAECPSDEQALTVAQKSMSEMSPDGDGMISKKEWFSYACRQAGIE